RYQAAKTFHLTSGHCAAQCSLMCGSVRRVRMRARVSRKTLVYACKANSCILYRDRYMILAKNPSIMMLPRMMLPIRLPTVLKLPSEISEPKSRYSNGRSASPRRCRGNIRQRCEACWCADWARGGTEFFFSGQGQLAQSPKANM